MASIMIFSTLWGIALKEWKGAGFRTKCLVGLSLFRAGCLHNCGWLWKLFRCGWLGGEIIVVLDSSL